MNDRRKNEERGLKLLYLQGCLPDGHVTLLKSDSFVCE